MKPKMSMNKIASSDNSPDPVLEKFDELYGTLKRLTKADGDMKKLKDVIITAEKKVSKRQNLQTETELSDGVQKLRKRSANIIIPKVYKKYTSARRVPDEAIVLDDDKCPKWLLLTAEGYTAIRECYFEIKEELKVICNKFSKQENYYTNMCDRRHMEFNDEFAENLVKAVNAANLRYSEKRDKLTIKIGEQLQELEMKKHKEEQLRSVNNQVQKEIQKIMAKYEGICPSLDVATVFNEGIEARLKQYNSSAEEKVNQTQSLRSELEEKKKAINEIRTTNCLNISKMMEEIRELTSSYSKAKNKEQILTTKLSETNQAIKDFKDVILEAKSTKDHIFHLLCKKEEEISGLTERLKMQKIIAPDTLDKKKRLQEKYQSTYTKWCEENEKFLKELESKNKELEKIKATIFEEKTNYIVPMKLQINEINEKFQKISDECTAITENSLILKKAGYQLEDEHLDLLRLQKKIKFLLVTSKCKLSRTKKRLNMRPKSADSLLSRDSDAPSRSLCSVSSEISWNPGSSLSISQSESELTVISRDGRGRSEMSTCICFELEDAMLLNTIDAECSFKEMTIYSKRLKKLRKRESALYKAVTCRRIQIHRLEETKVLIASEYICTLSAKSYHHPGKGSGQIDEMSEPNEHPKKSSMLQKGPRSNSKADIVCCISSRKLSKNTREEYADNSTNQLHAQFSKLLFL